MNDKIPLLCAGTCILILICSCFDFDKKNMESNIQQYYPIFTHLVKYIFPGSDTPPTQVEDMDPWSVTWLNLNDLIG